MSRDQLRRCIAGLVLVLAVPSARSAAQGTLSRFERTTCDFPPPAIYPADIRRECGRLVVPEVRGRANSRTFRLAVVIYRAQEPDGSPPLLLLHGGPGGLGGTRFVWEEMQFPLVRRRDVVVFDMRGAGQSEPRLCPDFEEKARPAFNLATRKQWEKGYRAAVRGCVASLDAQGIERSAYGADVNAADAIDLRRALGYATWDIYGVSYGGHVVQELLRSDARATRAAVLVSAVPPGPDYAAEAGGYQPHLERVIASCAAQPACHRAFPSLEEDFYALYEEFSRKPVEVPVAGATPPRTLLLNGERFLMQMRRQFGALRVPRLPLLISELRRGDREAALRRLVGNGTIEPWDALLHLVGCNESGKTYRATVAALKPKLRPAFQTIADDFRDHCDLWLPNPPRQIDPQPIASSVPTLVLHGEFDPVDVKAFQQKITAKLAHAYTYILPGETHAEAPVGCHGLIVKAFLENPTRAPNSSCLARMPRIRFKTRDFNSTVTFAVTSAAHAPTSLAGIWEAAVGGEVNPDWTMQLEIEDSALRGTVLERLLPIYDGKVEGTTLSFKVRVATRIITFTGKLEGDELHFTRAVEAGTSGIAGGLLGTFGVRSFNARRVR